MDVRRWSRFSPDAAAPPKVQIPAPGHYFSSVSVPRYLRRTKYLLFARRLQSGRSSLKLAQKLHWHA